MSWMNFFKGFVSSVLKSPNQSSILIIQLHLKISNSRLLMPLFYFCLTAYLFNSRASALSTKLMLVCLNKSLDFCFHSRLLPNLNTLLNYLEPAQDFLSTICDSSSSLSSLFDKINDVYVNDSIKLII